MSESSCCCPCHEAKQYSLERPCTLYRVWDSAGRLLYIGSTFDLRNRFNGHVRTDAPWLPFVAYIRLDRFATEDAARWAETLAIFEESPHFNIAGTRDYRPRGVPRPLLPELAAS